MLQLPSLPWQRSSGQCKKFPAAADSSNLHWNTGKGGRIVMDSDMNVTVHEDYSTSALSTVLFSFHSALQTMSLISSGIYGTFYIVIEQVGHFLNWCYFSFQPKKPVTMATSQITEERSSRPETLGKRCALITCVVLMCVCFSLQISYLLVLQKWGVTHLAVKMNCQCQWGGSNPKKGPEQSTSKWEHNTE